ncbi:MAG: alpha-amylase family glycosyl hydrolase [Opitutae bacterium]
MNFAHSPEWWRGAALYQIYPRSFADSNGDGIGDLPGISAHLDYVSSLGVDGLWLSPFFPSPMRDFGYDVSDHCGVDPMFGTLADFDVLLAAAHARGLKVVIDQVWSHTALEHPWFLESREDRHNARADWYVWAEAKPDGSAPNNWQSWMGGPAWTWEPRRGQYYLHNFLREMPDLNFHCPAVQEAILAVARFWLDRGVDGFRLDTANYYFHNRALPDNPAQTPARRGDSPVMMMRHIHNICQPENIAFLEKLRSVLDAYPGRMTVAEIGSADDNLARMIEYTRGHNRLHTAYSFQLLNERHDPDFIVENMAPWQEGDGAAAWPSWAFSNHDTPRVASRWGGPNADPASSQLWLTLLACLRGTIFLFQGEELGLPQADIALADMQDPFGKANWPRNKGRDGCRTPMPWSAGLPGAGFTTGHPWLPIAPAHRPLAVDRQEAEAASSLQLTRRLLALRHAHPALRWGSFEPLITNESVLYVRRQHGEDVVLVAFNFGNISCRLELDPVATAWHPALQLRDALVVSGSLNLGPRSAWIGTRSVQVPSLSPLA